MTIFSPAPEGARTRESGGFGCRALQTGQCLGSGRRTNIRFPVDAAQVADALGLSLVHINKTLARLRRMGMFTQANGMLTLTNPCVLERIGQYFDEDILQRPLI